MFDMLLAQTETLTKAVGEVVAADPNASLWKPLALAGWAAALLVGGMYWRSLVQERERLQKLADAYLEGKGVTR